MGVHFGIPGSSGQTNRVVGQWKIPPAALALTTIIRAVAADQDTDC
jgi:hypothetical protein